MDRDVREWLNKLEQKLDAALAGQSENRMAIVKLKGDLKLLAVIVLLGGSAAGVLKGLL